MPDQRDDKLPPPATNDSGPDKSKARDQNAKPADGESPQQQASDKTQEKPKPSPLANPAVRLGLIIGGVVIFVIILIFVSIWWIHGRFVQGTNDAYLQADQVTISPKIQGYVEKVLVTDNQMVQAGQPLVQIDGSTYQATMDQQTATVAARQADIVAAQRQVAQQTAALDKARADLAGAQATAAYAGGEADRYKALAAQGVETAAQAAQMVNQSNTAAAQARAEAAAVREAQLQIATQKAQVGQAQAQLKAAQAEVASAQLNINDTILRASIPGRIGDKQVRVGQFVQPGTRLMDVVPTEDIYLVANFKETQIGRMRIGQAAVVKIDALQGRKVDAILDSFAPGTGAQFALLPPENATGNFTKIVQRVPVRFRLVHLTNDDRAVLLPGLSATVSVDTTKAPVVRPAADQMGLPR
jgi:membrane fusion protein (multidrug efflux system)